MLIGHFRFLIAFTFLASAATIHGADFFPETDNPVDQAEIKSLAGAGLTLTNAQGEDEVVIDDMRFRLSDLLITGFSGRKWTNGKIFYQFDPNVSPSNRAKFRDACKVWEDVSAVRCVERKNNEPNFVHVLDSSFNRSFVGMIGGGQDLEIFNWNHKFIIAHEIGHALGLSHEQSRSDRDTFVEILFANIEGNAKGNFRKRNTANHTDYDFRSIMHYGPKAFTKNDKLTIKARPPHEGEQQHMGNRSKLSAEDASGMAAQYGPPR